MLQFYFLSIVTLILGGTALIGASGKAMDQEVTRLLNRTWVKVGLGVLAVLVGIVKFFVRAPLDTVAVVGDLLPALAGIAVGLALLADSYVTRSSQSEEAQKVSKAASFYRIPLGVVAIAAGLAHFFVPGAVIL